MLRITLPRPGTHPSVYLLEGKLASVWANELLRVTGGIGPKSGCIFDLEAVSFVDALGEEALCWLNRQGSRFVTDTLYGKELCKRLNLHRICRARLLEQKSPQPTHVSGS